MKRTATTTETMDENEIQLGDRYQDTVTGFEGIATARYSYLHGCTRVLLEAQGEPGDDAKSEVFDAPRLIHADTAKQVTSEKTGGRRPGPPSRDP